MRVRKEFFSAKTSINVLAAATIMAVAVFLADAKHASAETFEVQMYNKNPDDKKQRMVFVPKLLRIQPGDTVKFIPTNKGHNSQSIKGMLPDGVDAWKSKLNKEFEITLDTPGVYGYKCAPHLGLGMVGVIVVEGDGWDSNLAAAQEVKQRGKAKKAFEEIWSEL